MIKIGIVGYGNLGKGIEKAVAKNDDMELVGIFTRRDPKSLETSSPAYKYDEMEDFVGKIDVMLLAGGSANDILNQTNYIAKHFNTVDAFDTHAKIPAYYAEIEKIAKENSHLSLLSTGWDPGLFSLNRALFEAILPDGVTYTFWGKGVSQGHSDAIRRIEGVLTAIQYTIPNSEVIDRIRNGETPDLTTREKHTRLCYVVAAENADKARIEEEIVTMKNYFDEYDTTVNFITMEEFKTDHTGIPHGGSVLRNGKTSGANNEVVEFTLKLDSNPEFTSSTMVACARAVVKMNNEGTTGALTILDIPVAKMLNKTKDEILHMI